MLTADGGSGARCRERGSEGTINGEPYAGDDKDKVGRVVAKMIVTEMTDDKVRKMITRIQEVGDMMMIDQIRTVIVEIQEDGGEGRGEMYKDESGDHPHLLVPELSQLCPSAAPQEVPLPLSLRDATEPHLVLCLSEPVRPLLGPFKLVRAEAAGPHWPHQRGR